MSGAVAATRDELIILIDSTGSMVTLADVPVVAWLVDEDGAAPALPVTLWTLTPLWAQVEFETRHLTPGLIGAATCAAKMCDESFRGGFSDFLDHLEVTTGLPITGTQLVNGTLISAFGSWLGLKHGGRTFSAVGP